MARVNRAIDHVVAHLAEPLPLEEVARVAAFSPFHFHRIFRAVTGETLAAFVKRVRLERAAHLISHRKDARLTDIALACGFSSSSDFTRSFKAQYGMPPSAFDSDAFRAPRREAMIERDIPEEGRHRVRALPVAENPDGFEARLIDLPARTVAYIRVMQGYAGGLARALERLTDWATKRGLAGGQWLGYQWDDPEIVPREKCRYDAGLEVPAGTDVEPQGDVMLARFESMRVAEVDIAGPIDLELRAIHWLYFSWLPRSGCAPAHAPMFEAWNGRPFAHGGSHFELRLHLPVVDAREPL